MLMRALRLSVLTFATLAALCTAARADVFRCVGPDGKTLYSDSPCPQEAVKKSNITDAVGACNTAECESKRQQAVNEARERLRAEKSELADMTQKRMERERAAFEEQRWRQAIESQIAASADQAAMAAGNPIYYPAYPIGAAAWPCRGTRCVPPGQRPDRGNPANPAHPSRPPHASHPQKSIGLPLRVDR
jgi:uncharacterized protein DUF4124